MQKPPAASAKEQHNEISLQEISLTSTLYGHVQNKDTVGSSVRRKVHSPDLDPGRLVLSNLAAKFRKT